MDEWQQHIRRELRPPHEYSWEQFGLSEDNLKLLFAEYREQFILGRQATGFSGNCSSGEPRLSTWTPARVTLWFDTSK